MVVYEMPTNVGNMTSFMQWGNTTLEGYAGILVLLAFFVIGYVTVSWRTESGNAFTFSMIITTFMAMFFRIIGIVDSTTLFICFILTGIGFVIISKSRSSY